MSKKSRLDLLVRVRYLNPLPAPPYPPKLFDIPTDITRLGEPSYLSQLASSTPLPMLVDSEMGMPLNLNEFDGVWDGDESTIRPDADGSSGNIDPEDAILLAPHSAAVVNGGAGEIKQSAAEVSWMRSSSLFQRKMMNKRKEVGEVTKDKEVDASETAQIMAIDKSFTDLYHQDPLSVKHPDEKKRGLHVIESYDLLPDDDCFDNSYIMMRFPERPTGATTALSSIARPSSPSLEGAFLKPKKDEDGIHNIEYFIPREEDVPQLDDIFERAVGEDVVEEVRQLAEEDAQNPRIPELLPSALYGHLRTYETVSSIKPEKEVLMVFEEESDEREAKRRKGVYYTGIHMRTLLRKTRAKRREEVQENADRWDKVLVGYRLMTEEEEDIRRNALGQVNDHTWASEELRRLHGGDNQAEGMGEAIEEDE